MRLQNGVELPHFILGHGNFDLVAACVKRGALEADRKQGRARLLADPASNRHLDCATADEGAVFTTFADARLEILIEIPSDWIAHRADDQRAAAADGPKL